MSEGRSISYCGGCRFEVLTFCLRIKVSLGFLLQDKNRIGTTWSVIEIIYCLTLTFLPSNFPHSLGQVWSLLLDTAE